MGERYSNLEIVERLATVTGLALEYEFMDYHARRTGHDLHYGLDGGKLSGLGWTPPVAFADSLERTALWYQENPIWLEV